MSNIDGGVALAVGLAFGTKPIPAEFALALSSQCYPTNSRRRTFAIKGKEVGEARQLIAELAIEHGAKYLWFVDYDMSFPMNTCSLLTATLENADEDTMVCGGIYTRRAHPAEPLVYRGEGLGSFWKWKAGDVFEVTGLATGCMLIKTEVFAHLEKPWFKTISEGQTSRTEDLFFSDRVRDAGFKILADSNVLCVHWDWDAKTHQFTPYCLAPDSYPLRPVSEKEPRCQRELGEGVLATA